MMLNIPSNLKSIIRIIHDLVKPYCAKCGTRSFPHKHCELCDSICKINQADSLKDNYTKYLKIDDQVNKAEYICEKCFNSRELTKCAKTGYVFLRSKDQMQKFYNSQMWRNLFPHHPSSQISGSLSPEGFTIIEQEHKELQNRCLSWAGCTKQEFLREYRIKKEIKLIRTINEHDDPAQVESELKWHCLQIGGNGLIKFFSDKHIEYHEEEYIAGYGSKGNPYYRTKRWTTAYFSGHAVAIIAESRKSSFGSQKTEKPKNDKSSYLSEDDCWRILGLSGNICKQDIKNAYRKTINEYHPDKVASLGTELRALAEKKAKEINEAYQFLKKRYSL